MNNNGPKSLLRDTNLRIIFSVTLIAVMGVASITPAFPTIIDVFNIDKEHIAWLITVFTVPGVFLTPVMGIIADRIGRKRVIVPSLFLFAIAGFSCAFATSFEMLVAFRFFQGIGAASIGSLNITLIGDIYQGKQRAAAMGYNASVLSVGTAIYPLIGGFLASLGWNYPFFFPILAIPVGIWILMSLKNPEPKNNEHFFRYIRNALRSMASRKVIGVFVLSIATFIILYGAYLTVFPLFLKARFDANPIHIGVIMSAMSVSTAITSSQLGKLSKKYNPRTLIMTGFFLYGLSLVLVPMVHQMYVILIPAVIFGIAQGLNLPATQTLLSNLSTLEYRAAFMSINGMVLRLGQTIGPVLVGLIMADMGTPMAFILSGILAGTMVIFTFIMLR